MSSCKYDKLPIAETFHSIQGEGAWVGTPMFFIRLAGCNVGQYNLSREPKSPPAVRKNDLRLLLDNSHAVCCTLEGTEFLCDTDYGRTASMTPEELLEEADEKHICLTGGEPFLYDLMPLIQTFEAAGKKVHIETSGTRPIHSPVLAGFYPELWITCSPKKGFIFSQYDVYSEWKILVGVDFSLVWLNDFLRPGDRRPVYLQPINGVCEPNHESTQRVLRLVLNNRHKGWKLSVQLHKYLEVQ